MKEIDLRAAYLNGETVETIYFGGGTPSLLPDKSIGEIINSLSDHFPISSDLEISLEVNPDDLVPERLENWRKYGVNRLSIGIQSFFDEDLVWMNRAHNSNEAIRAVQEAKKMGFTNFSLDLIYGTPLLTDEKWLRNLAETIALDPAHISCYALTVEPKTALDKMIRMNKTPDIQPEKQAAQFLTGIEVLEKAGYNHYEISSFAKPGMQSRHNSSYWRSRKYLGLGPSAHSFNGISRQWNISNNAAYIKSMTSGSVPFELETLTPTDKLNEYIMTSLRTGEGLDLNNVTEQFGNEKRLQILLNAEKFLSLKQMIRNRDQLVLTREGKLFADGIAAALFFN